MEMIEGYRRPRPRPRSGSPHRASHLEPRTLAAVLISLATTVLLEGCAVITVAGAAASVAATAASTAVDVGVGAVKVTGKVIGKGVDLVTGGPAAPGVPNGPPTPASPNRQ